MMRGQRVDLRQNQSMVMTPELLQAIQLLQMSNLEVSAFVEKQMEKNPLLELEDADTDYVVEAFNRKDTGHHDLNDLPKDGDGIITKDVQFASDPIFDALTLKLVAADGMVVDRLYNEESPRNLSYENVFEPKVALGGVTTDDGMHDLKGSLWGPFEPSGWSSENLYGIEHLAVSQTTLRDHLIEQVHLDFGDPADQMIAIRLIDILDENGWLSSEFEWLATDLGCSVERVEATLARCQQMDPPGVFGRNLSECLELQARETGQLNPPMKILLKNLPLLAKCEFAKLRRLCSVDTAELHQMVLNIKKLNPKPASVFNEEVVQAIVPDVFVNRGKGGWIVELNGDTLPKVLINHRYYAIVKKSARTKKEKEFLSDCLTTAGWLKRALHQRAETILKIASELVAQQEAFLEKGVEYLKPMTLSDIAEVVQMHESTVSRVTTNKYLGISRGVFEMKYFFHSAIQNNKMGTSSSSESVRFRIKALIDEEMNEDVISDDRIVELLGSEGITIARRTVAKYRDVMRIPSSFQRRRDKLLQVGQ